AGLLAWVVAHAAGDGRERHVFLDERIRVQILAALHQVEIPLNLFVGPASVVARWQLVAIHGPDRAPVAGGEQVLSLFLRWRRRNAGERDLEPIGNFRAFSRHVNPSYLEKKKMLCGGGASPRNGAEPRHHTIKLPLDSAS